MLIHVLFRFRDLTDHTIARHREVIAEHGQCWWGWWKRPAEQPHGEVWEYLQQQINQSGHVDVGFFDSGAADVNAVHTARVIAIIRPTADALAVPPTPADEQHLVPKYYRASPFSRAWLKLTSISETPIPFFNQYSYESPPPLPHVPSDYLQRLKGKVVPDASELRAMDITIWRVRPKGPGDLEERFLAPSIRVLKALSSEPISARGSKILHLTDLHFADGKHSAQHRWDIKPEGPRGTLAENVGRVTSELGIGLVIISGDFTFIGSSQEFEQAERSINALLGTLGLGSDNLIIVPGNHDIVWTNFADGYDHRSPVQFAPQQAKQEYVTFYRRLMRHEPHQDLSMARRFVLPSGVLLDVGALNSCSLEHGPNYLSGMGRVTPAAFGRIRHELGWKDSCSLGLRLLVIHHHLTATEDVENPAEYSSGFGMAIDAKRTLRDAATYGVQIVLHGHRHRPFVWNEGVYARPEFNEPQWGLGRVAVVGGGSGGSTSVDGNRNFFNVLDITPKTIVLEMYRSENASHFAPMTRWAASLETADGHLLLGDWVRAD